jgi:hypothetical protein
MAAKSRSKKYRVSDVYQEANKMLKEEMQNLKKRPLSQSEEIQMKELAKVLSKTVLGEMNII